MTGPADVGRLLVAVGIVLALLGGLLWALGRAGFRGLPGDVVYERDGVRVWIPIATCLALSLALSLALWLWRRLGR